MTLLAAAAVSALALLWIALAPGRSDGPSAPREGPLGDASTIALEGREIAEALALTARSPQGAQAAALESVPAAKPVEPEGPARSLALAVVERGSRRPLAGFVLALRQGEAEVILATDALGNLSTPRVWSADILSMRHLPDAARTEYRAAWRLEPWQISLGEEREPTLLLVAQPPELVLEADALLPDGSGLEGVEVTLVHGWRDGAREFHAESVDPERTDADGRARFAVFPEEARATSAYLAARDDERGLASAPLFLDPPLAPGPWRLSLLPMGSVRLRVVDHDGRPLARGHASAVSAEVLEAASSLAVAPIEQGSSLLERLAPARHRLRVRDAATGDVRSLVVDVLSGREVFAEARFDDGRTRLAAAGTVVDEEGRPIRGATVWLDAPRSAERFAFTDAEGAFEFWAEPAERAIVGTESDVGSDLFHPATLDVPFGTRELVFRRAARLLARRVRFEVRDADTGAPLSGGGVHAWIGEPRAEGGWKWASLAEGRAELELSVRPGLCYAVRCRGYVEEEGELAPPQDEAQPWVLEVALRRGFTRVLRVVERASGAPIAGARVREPGGSLSVLTDQDGRARLSADEWPARLWIEKAGHRERVVDPLDLELVSGRVELEALAR